MKAVLHLVSIWFPPATESVEIELDSGVEALDVCSSTIGSSAILFLHPCDVS